MNDNRDIDFVLVTGAGASCSFGVGGTQLPMMGEWVDALVQKLAGVSSGYLKATGLSKGLPPMEFEKRLGTFLHQVTAFSEIESLVGVTREFMFEPDLQRLVAPVGVIESWHQSTKHHLAQIVELVHESLYELFADPSVDIQRANDAYGGLFEMLGIEHGSQFVYATTNYDTIGERVIGELQWNPDWGEPPQAQTSEQRLSVDGLIQGLPRYVPVLHLHGRVGWYRRLNGSRTPEYATTTTRHQQGFGVPIVMLPDPNKAYGSDPVISSLWTQFEEALRRARRVFVLGHSLNDTAIVRALQDNVEPLDRIAVTILGKAKEPDTPDASAIEVMDRIRLQLGNAALIPMRFGSHPNAGQEGIETWLGRKFGD